ncbi:CBS domain-containing protein [Aestuariirhabdus litorea]|uniref:CBS domain-containing protein n=1 Tax=Aestuariirhabdus litorea TaxID=2528527 RepID=A0A3P3VNK5_9GAMM|nr:CBS domain-containing protein [Aestuariirhabdus litorea]RRJ83927.1 CBS domain-containing protein [Aestuariirhabdus litorea]RWW97149.1 CBS domain-containing protein [Endozoicomonadaceae bacterium GTF-13]
MSEQRRITVSEVMKGQFIEMDGLMTVAEAIQALVKESAHTLIIKKRHDHDEYGIVVLADISKKVLARDRSPERVNLYEIMTKPVLSVAPDMDIRYCARLFDQFGLACAPVLDKGQMVGVITYEEIVLHGLLALVSD